MAMTWQDYKDQVRSDALDVIGDEHEDFESFEGLMSNLFIDDSVTGGGSGSYTFNASEAAENVSGIIFDPEAKEAFRDYGYEALPTDRGAEALDVLARCIALEHVGADLERRYDELASPDGGLEAGIAPEDAEAILDGESIGEPDIDPATEKERLKGASEARSAKPPARAASKAID